MTVKGLITRLLDCEMDKEIYAADDVVFENKDGKIYGSAYNIDSIYEGAYVYLNIDNRNHFKRKEQE